MLIIYNTNSLTVVKGHGITMLFKWFDSNGKSKSDTDIDFSSRLNIAEDDGWASLNLLLVNRSHFRIWAEEARITITGLDANWQTSLAAGQAIHAIRQSIGPQETLALSLGETIYKAAGAPQGVYTCFVSTSVRLRSDDGWFERVDQQRRLEMKALRPVSLRSLKWNEQPFAVAADRLIQANH